MKRFGLFLFLAFVLAMPVVCIADNAYDTMVKFHTIKDKDSTDAAGQTVPWCVATLWLGPDDPCVTSSEIDYANTRLDDLDDSAKFTQIPETASWTGVDSISLYWALPDIVRGLYGSNTSYAARASMRNVLKNFVKYRDKYADASLDDSDIFEISGSMNHDWTRKTTYLLTAQHFKALNGGSGWNIYADGYTAQQHYDRWNAHLKEKLKQMASRGLGPELSPGYCSITLQALFNLADNSEDTVLSGLADDFISLYLADYAKDSFHGIRGGGQTRVYKNGWAYNPPMYMRGFTYLFANDPTTLPFTSPDRTILGASMSDYNCPSVVQNLMRQAKNSTDYPHSSRRPAKGSETTRDGGPFYQLDFTYSDMRRFTYITSKYILGGFAIDDTAASSYYTRIHTQNQWVGMVTDYDIYSRIYFQCGSPTTSISGYRELTAVGHRSAMLVKRQEQVEGDPQFFCWMSTGFRGRRVGPDSDTDYWIFSRNTDSSVYVGVKAVDATSASFYTLSTDGPGYGDPLRIDFADSNTIAAIQVGKATDFVSFTAFQTAVKAKTFSKVGTEVSFDTLDGYNLKMYTDGSASKLDGNTFGLNIGKTYDGYYLYNSTYDSPVIYVKDPNGNLLTLDFNY